MWQGSEFLFQYISTSIYYLDTDKQSHLIHRLIKNRFIFLFYTRIDLVGESDYPTFPFICQNREYMYFASAENRTNK